MKAQVEMDAALWKVISQIKLPLTAISSMLILKQHITFTQIFLMTAIAMTIMVYCQKGIKQAVIKDWGNFGVREDLSFSHYLIYSDWNFWFSPTSGWREYN